MLSFVICYICCGFAHIISLILLIQFFSSSVSVGVLVSFCFYCICRFIEIKIAATVLGQPKVELILIVLDEKTEQRLFCA